MHRERPPLLVQLQKVNDFSDRLPRGALTAAGVLLLSVAVLLDWRPTGAGIAFPLYYLIPVGILAWFAGWLPTLASTLIAAAMSAAGLVLSARLAPFTALFIVGRVLTLALSLLLARALATIRLMIDYYLLGDQLRAHIVPIRIGARLVSIPTRDPDIRKYDFELKPDDVPLLIRPGTAFGSGSHATTQMCLMLIEDHLEPGALVFDFGSGSGILSIAAAKLGARAVYAVDIAPRAERVVHENIKLNELENVIRFQRGSWPVFLDPPSEWRSSPGERADLLVGNILTPILVNALEEGLGRCVRPGGTLILSGIHSDDWNEMRTALDRAGLSVVERRQMKEWLAVAALAPLATATGSRPSPG